jgi:hypothetical protein
MSIEGLRTLVELGKLLEAQEMPTLDPYTAYLITPEGECTPIAPSHGRHFSIEELYEHIKCSTVEMHRLHRGTTMWMDEEGKYNPDNKVNLIATKLLGVYPNDVVVGRVVLARKGQVS